MSSVQVAIVVLAVSWVVYFFFKAPSRLYSGFNNVEVIKNRFPGLGAVGFFANRYNYLNEKVTQDPNHPHHGIAKFNLLGKIVYTVGGTDEETMKAICTNKDLSFSQGNNFLFAGIAGAKQKGLTEEGEMDAEEKREMRELAKAISPQRLNAVAPQLVADAFEAINDWFTNPSNPNVTTIDLQKTYYPLVFRFTVRVMGMAEYASSPALLQKLFTAFWRTQRNSGFWTTILPFVPQPRLFKRLFGAYTLWSMVRSTLDQRVKEGRKEDDYAQDLIDRGMAHNSISRFVIGGLIAGILNTIGTGAYSVAFVGADPELQQTCRTSLIAGLKKCAESRGDVWEDLAPQEALSRITLEEWESTEEFEVLHLVFRESIRLLLTNSLNRYYPGPSISKDGKPAPRLEIYGNPIEDDTYICFSPSSQLHDSSVFPNPFTFDALRYKRGQGALGDDYAFIAWGAGYHRCTGMRFAKLETIIALSAFLMATNGEGGGIRTVDGEGVVYAKGEVPLPDLSQGHWRSPRKTMRVEIRR